MRKIRVATIYDLDQIEQIEKASFKDPYPRSLLALLITLGKGLFLVAEEGREIVGYIYGEVNGERGHLVSIAVSPNKRRKGVGSDLLKHLLEWFALKGVREVYLEVEVCNREAIRFYEKHGFKKLGVKKDYYGVGRDAYIYVKKLRG